MSATPLPATRAPLRIYLGAFGQPGHAFPMLALGRRLVQRGHQVSYETWERWRPHVVAAGMEFVAAPEYPTPAGRAWTITAYEAAARAAPSTLAAIRASHTQIVVHDILTLAPAFAAELEGIPAATLVPHLYPVGAPGLAPYSSGARLPRTRAGRRLWWLFERPLRSGLELGREQLNAARREVGLPATGELHGGLSTQLCLVATFPQLEYPRIWPEHVHVVGPILWEPPASGAPVLRTGAPLALIAPSTSHDPDHRLVRAALTGLRGLELHGRRLQVLAALDNRPAARPIRAGFDARLVNWISYTQAMSEASLVICHGGHGTIARALERGVPVLAVPHSGDMAENAARLDWSGTGVRLPWRLLRPATVRLAALHALGEHRRLAANAARLAAWAEANDGATRAAELIERALTRAPG